MAVGKGSMERASKAAAKTAAPVAKATETAPVKKTAVKKPAVKKTTTKAAPKVSAAAIPAPSPEVMEKILYQNSAEMLYRDAEPNERFEIGDSMPVYYF